MNICSVTSCEDKTINPQLGTLLLIGSGGKKKAGLADSLGPEEASHSAHTGLFFKCVTR